MPQFREHCEYTLNRYGVDGASIHKWMDEPAKIQGPSHRKFRHISDQKIPQFLIEEYGHNLARNIMIDHIMLDSETKTGARLLSDTPQLRQKIRRLEQEKLELIKENLELINKFDKKIYEIEQVIKINPQIEEKLKNSNTVTWNDVFNEIDSLRKDMNDYKIKIKREAFVKKHSNKEEAA